MALKYNTTIASAPKRSVFNTRDHGVLSTLGMQILFGKPVNCFRPSQERLDDCVNAALPNMVNSLITCHGLQGHI